jgi:hypothetical protein
MSEIWKQTKFVHFKRHLWPPSPKDAIPHWCYINTLHFHEGSLVGPLV